MKDNSEKLQKDYDNIEKELNGGPQLQAPHGRNPKEDILIYDIMTTPQGIDLEKIVYLFREHNVILYDSFKGGTSPKVMNKVKHIAFIDVEGEKISNQINKIIKER
jgi:hypothetical protein